MIPSSGLRLGRIFGIEIVINPTWLLIFFLVALSFGDLFRITGVDGELFPGGVWPWAAGLVAGVVFFACLLIHELSHSLVAKRNGIVINRITLFLFGGVAEMTEDVKSPGTEFRMAIAGPVVTFLLAGLFFLLYWLTDYLKSGPLIIVPLFYLGAFNTVIGLFNLLPGFPLDGGRVLRSIIWKVTGDMLKATRVASISGQVIAVMISGGGVYLILTGGWIGGLWLLFISFFLYRLAEAGYRQTLYMLAASDTRVSDIMYTDVPQIDAGTSLTGVRTNYFPAYRLPAFPVVEQGKLIGVITGDELGLVPRAEWDLLNAGRLAKPISSFKTVSPDTPLDRVMKTILRGESFLLVMEGPKVVGLLTREELLRYIEMKLKILRRRT